MLGFVLYCVAASGLIITLAVVAVVLTRRAGREAELDVPVSTVSAMVSDHERDRRVSAAVLAVFDRAEGAR